MARRLFTSLPLGLEVEASELMSMPSLDRTPRRPRATLALISMAFGLAAASGAASLGLSADQQHRLAAGEVVVLDTLPPGASKSSGGGTAVGLVRLVLRNDVALLRVKNVLQCQRYLLRRFAPIGLGALDEAQADA